MPQFSNCDNNGNPFQNGADHTDQFDPRDIQANKLVCGFSYLGILFFLPLVACPNSPFGRFHANQSLIFLIAGIVMTAARKMLSWIWIVGDVLALGISLLYLVFLILSMINAFQGKAKELPLIGHLRLIK